MQTRDEVKSSRTVMTTHTVKRHTILPSGVRWRAWPGDKHGARAQQRAARATTTVGSARGSIDAWKSVLGKLSRRLHDISKADGGDDAFVDPAIYDAMQRFTVALDELSGAVPRSPDAAADLFRVMRLTDGQFYDAKKDRVGEVVDALTEDEPTMVRRIVRRA